MTTDTYQAASGALIHVDTEEEQGQRALERHGPKEREASLWAFLTGELSSGLIVDAGANYGQVSLAATYDPDAQVHLFEPNPRQIEFLEASIATHPQRSQIAIHQTALGPRDGTATLFVRPEAMGKSSLVTPSAHPVEVPCQRLDSIFGGEDSTQQLIMKLDVEGSELPILAGGHNLLNKCEDLAIMIELHPRLMVTASGSIGHFVEQLCQYGSLWQQTNSGRFTTFNIARFIERGSLHDILIVRGDRYLDRVASFARGA